MQNIIYDRFKKVTEVQIIPGNIVLEKSANITMHDDYKRNICFSVDAEQMSERNFGNAAYFKVWESHKGSTKIFEVARIKFTSPEYVKHTRTKDKVPAWKLDRSSKIAMYNYLITPISKVASDIDPKDCIDLYKLNVDLNTFTVYQYLILLLDIIVTRKYLNKESGTEMANNFIARSYSSNNQITATFIPVNYPMPNYLNL